jgi:hypothetical protein
MIKKEELRIGNMVHFDNLNKRYPSVRVIKIKELGEKEAIVIDLGLDMALFYDSDNLKPIPLTPEILEGCGFERVNNAWAMENEITDDRFSLFDKHLCKGKLKLHLNNMSGPTPFVKHLHQLQNLYFALTGKELNYRNNDK